MPAPPSSSLQGTPRSPSSPMALMFSQGNSEVRSSSRATGAIRSAENSRTISRTWWCCSVK